MMATRALEFLDQRAWAALRFVDVIGRAVLSPVGVTGTPVIKATPNRLGLTVITHVDGFDAYEDGFASPPANPAIGSVPVALDVTPADSGLAPRRILLALPRDAAGNNAANANSLFQPVDVTLLPTPGFQLTGLTAGLRVTVTRTTDGALIEGALVRLSVMPNGPEARAITNAAGEALVVAAGLPLFSVSGPKVVGDHPATVDVVVVPQLARFHPLGANDVANGAPFSDPDTLEAQPNAKASATKAVRVAAGRTLATRLQWAPPPPPP